MQVHIFSGGHLMLALRLLVYGNHTQVILFNFYQTVIFVFSFIHYICVSG
jgi:hypothetical protein